MTAFFIKLVNMSIAASWLILAVILLRLVLFKAPKWIHCILWGIVAVRLICPVSFESPLSLIPSAEIINSDIAGYASKPISGNDDLVINGPAINDSMINDLTVPVVREDIAPTAETNIDDTYSWMRAAGFIWIIGVISLLSYSLIRYFRLYRSVSEAIRLRENIWLCDKVKSPFIFGMIHPRIYLSSGTEDSCMSDILAHEQAHIKRNDHWWKLLGYMLLAVYWFNPLSWIAYILLCRDIELACDEKVIRGFNKEEKRRYANSLVSCSLQRRVIMACPPAFGEVGVRQRVKSVLGYKKPAVGTVMISVFDCLIVAVCFLTTSPGVYHLKATIPTAIGTMGIEIPAAGDGTDAPPAPSYSDEGSLPADAFPIELLYASGASSSGTTLLLNADGSFAGQHYDHENAAGADYPNGTCYICNFSGRFENFTQINEHTYSMTLGEIAAEHEEGEEWIEEGTLYIAAKPFGLEDGKGFLFYTPGTPLETLSEEFLSWWMGYHDESSQTLPCYGLYNIETGAGFFHYE